MCPSDLLVCRIYSFLCNLIGSFVVVLWQRLKIDGLPDTALEKEARKCVPSCEVNRLHKNSRNVNHSPLSVVVCITTSSHHINNKVKEWQLIYLAGISVRCLASMYDKPYNMFFFWITAGMESMKLKCLLKVFFENFDFTRKILRSLHHQRVLTTDGDIERHARVFPNILQRINNHNH